jgi:8-oxo-dGTP pyrophosphatase MutT (NUDIX family)
VHVAVALGLRSEKLFYIILYVHYLEDMAYSMNLIKERILPLQEESEHFRRRLESIRMVLPKMPLPGHRNGKSQAAVLILLVLRENDIYVLLTKRSQNVGLHKGETCLPGGFMEDSDHTVVDAALREAQEEIGLHPNNVTVIGEMLPIINMVHHFLVTPVVAVLNSKDFEPSPNPDEVEDIFYLPLSRFLRKDGFILWHYKNKDTGYKFHIHIFTDEVDERYFITWGMTARLLIKTAVAIYQKETEYKFQMKEKLKPIDPQKWDKHYIRQVLKWFSPKL